MKKSIVLLILMVLIPISVKADNISIECNTEVVKSNTVTCNVIGNSSNIVTALSAKIRPGSNTSFSLFKSASVWEGNGENGEIDLYTANDIKGRFEIGTFTLGVATVNEGGVGSVTVDSVFFYDVDGLESTINPVTKTFRIASTINSLSSLNISVGTLNPKFNSDTTSYSTTIDASSITISAKAENSKSTISGDIGTKSLNYGSNKFNITVTSESGSSKTYTITVIRPNNNSNNSNNSNNQTQNNTNNQTSKISSNNNLKLLEIDYGNIKFSKDVTEYKTSVSYDVENIEVKAEAEDAKSKVEIDGNKNLKVGSNVITIKVVSEDNQTKIYTIQVERKEKNQKLSSNANISNIEISNYLLNFDKNTLEYILTIKDEDKLDIKVYKEDNTSNYTIEGNNKLENNSIIRIISIAEDGTEKIYKINIIKKDYDKTIKLIFTVIIAILVLINIIRISINIRSKLYEK